MPPRKLPPSYWITVAFCVLALAGFVFSVWETGSERRAARERENAKADWRAINRYCANWKADPQQFDECAGAFHVYEECELARLRMLESEGRGDAGVFCEHPTYHFHAQEQNEIQSALDAGSQQGK